MTADTEEITSDESLFFEHLKTNNNFTEFLCDAFDAQEYANNVIESNVIGESLAKLAAGINLLNNELLKQVSEHHEDLLSQATGIETLEGNLLERLNKITKVKSQVTEPYNRIASRTRQLRRLQVTCEHLRRIIRVLQLSKRLEVQMKGGHREITKAAQSLHELDYVLEGVDLTGIRLIEKDLSDIKEARVEVEIQAKAMLNQGLNTQNQTLIGTALTVFHNLGTLQKHVDSVIEESTNVVEKKTHQAVDANSLAISKSNPATTGAPGRAAMPALGSMASWSSVLWEEIERLTQNLYEQCQKVYVLEKVLLKKRDPYTHVSFIEEFSEVFVKFVSTHLRQAFEGEFPKLLRLFNDFWSQISALVDEKESQTSSTLPTDVRIGFKSPGCRPLESLKSALNPFENAYLSRSLSRLFDPINLVFPSGQQSVPSKEEVNTIVKTMSSELTVACVDEHLTIMISKNISKTVQLYIAKCEEMTITTSDAGQLTGGLTTSQIRNAALWNSLGQLKNGLSQVLPNLVYPPQEAISILDRALTNITEFMDASIGLLLSAIMASLQNKIARMQSENFSISASAYQDTADIQPCSRYVLEIQEFITRIYSDYLSLYNCGDLLVQRLELLAARSLELFVRHASLLRDIPEGGKLKLAADMAQIEFALTPFCRRFEDLGPSYKLFRAFRPLLFQALEDVQSNTNIGDSLPCSIVLHFLFSYAPPQMLSPHTVAGWTVPQYSDWLDDHTDEEERLTLVKGTLEAYSKKVREQGKTPPQVYTVMMKLLEHQQKIVNSS